MQQRQREPISPLHMEQGLQPPLVSYTTFQKILGLEEKSVFTLLPQILTRFLPGPAPAGFPYFQSLGSSWVLANNNINESLIERLCIIISTPVLCCSN